MARGTTLTDEISDRICTLLEEGNYLETAAQVCDVSINTVYSWLRQGREGLEPFQTFSQAVARARAQGEVSLLSDVKKGDRKGESFGRGRAAAHILGVTRPQRFGTKINVVVREQQAEFARFIEGQLGELLGEERGAEVFETIVDRWLNRQPVELAQGEGGGEPGDHETSGGPTLQ